MKFITGSTAATGPLLVCWLACISCATRISSKSFVVVPGTPAYSLRSPASQQTPFPEILHSYSGFERGSAFVDLRPGMELSIENAYYQPGMSRRGLAGFLGTETAGYKIEPHGRLRLLSVQSMRTRPTNQPAVDDLISPAQRAHRFFRFYYEVFFRRTDASRGSVLLSTDRQDDLTRLATQLIADPDSICRSGAKDCTVFPEACSVSLGMEVLINGARRSVLWGSTLASLADHPRYLQLLRLYNGRLAPVKLDATDDRALTLPLLPGDRLVFRP